MQDPLPSWREAVALPGDGEAGRVWRAQQGGVFVHRCSSQSGQPRSPACRDMASPSPAQPSQALGMSIQAQEASAKTRQFPK